MAKKAYAPIICTACHTDHGNKATRNEDCKALDAEKRIAHLYHNGGSAYAIRYAQADREDALGNHDKAERFRSEGLFLEQGGHF